MQEIDRTRTFSNRRVNRRCSLARWLSGMSPASASAMACSFSFRFCPLRSLLVLLLFLASFLRRLLDDASSTSESDDEAAGPVRRLASTLLLDEAGFPLFMCE